MSMRGKTHELFYSAQGTAIVAHDGNDDLKRVSAGPALTRRNMLEYAGMVIAAVAVPPNRLLAAAPQAPLSAAPSVSPVMEKLSTYMSEAAVRALPAEVAEKTKQHVLDTLAAMISGSELP